MENNKRSFIYIYIWSHACIFAHNGHVKWMEDNIFKYVQKGCTRHRYITGAG